MAKIIGIRPSSFRGSDGAQITGQNIYLTEPLDKGVGYAADRVFVTDSKLAGWPYKSVVGDEVHLESIRFGKCAGMSKAIK